MPVPTWPTSGQSPIYFLSVIYVFITPSIHVSLLFNPSCHAPPPPPATSEFLNLLISFIWWWFFSSLIMSCLLSYKFANLLFLLSHIVSSLPNPSCLPPNKLAISCLFYLILSSLSQSILPPSLEVCRSLCFFHLMVCLLSLHPSSPAIYSIL